MSTAGEISTLFLFYWWPRLNGSGNDAVLWKGSDSWKHVMPQDSEIFRLRMKNSLADGHSKFRHRACKSFCTEFIDGWSQPASQSELVLQSTGLPSAHERDWSSASSKGPRALCLELFSTSRFILNSYMLVSLAPA